MAFDRKKLKNWWWYHRVHVLIAVLALAVIVYSMIPNLLAPKPDCALAVAGRVPLPDETLTAIRGRLESAVGDLNGDGRVIVELSSYTVDLSGETEGYYNYQGAAAFDADLVGQRSGLFLFDDPAGFQANVAVKVEEMISCAALPLFAELVPDYWFTARSDNGEAVLLYGQIAR